jgi:hypothetical protein
MQVLLFANGDIVEHQIFDFKEIYGFRFANVQVRMVGLPQGFELSHFRHANIRVTPSLLMWAVKQAPTKKLDWL